jgi:hypothetical protein
MTPAPSPPGTRENSTPAFRPSQNDPGPPSKPQHPEFSRDRQLQHEPGLSNNNNNAGLAGFLKRSWRTPAPSNAADGTLFVTAEAAARQHVGQQRSAAARCVQRTPAAANQRPNGLTRRCPASHPLRAPRFPPDRQPRPRARQGIARARNIVPASPDHGAEQCGHAGIPNRSWPGVTSCVAPR